MSSYRKRLKEERKRLAREDPGNGDAHEEVTEEAAREVSVEPPEEVAPAEPEPMEPAEAPAEPRFKLPRLSRRREPEPAPAEEPDASPAVEPAPQPDETPAEAQAEAPRLKLPTLRRRKEAEPAPAEEPDASPAVEPAPQPDETPAEAQAEATRLKLPALRRRTEAEPAEPEQAPGPDGPALKLPSLRRKPKALAPAVNVDPARPTLTVPPAPDGCTVVEEHVVREGLCVTRLLFDEPRGIHLYEVHEPALEGFEQEVLDFLREGLLRSLLAKPEEAPDPDVEAVLAQRVDDLVRDHLIRIDAVSRAKVMYYLLRDFVGYGRIDAMMRDPQIEDISCDGPEVPVFLFHRQYEAMRTTVSFPKTSELDAYVLRLAQRAGKHVSIANPLLDATLPEKSRLQCTYGSEITTRGSSFTIRKFRTDPITPPLLLRYNTLSPEMAAYFWMAMEYGQSCLIVGGTASGKTTTLNACSLFIPSEKKIVSIEDTRELNLPHDNWVAGVTRGGGGELLGEKFAGEVSMYDLLAAALRQRPEYLIVGEVRGKEAMTLFQAMATGHATFSTMHADSLQGCIHRLEHPPIEVPRIMLESLRVVSIQAQVRVGTRLVRRIKEVAEIKGIDPNTNNVVTNTVFRWDPVKDRFERSPRSYVLDRIAERLQWSADEVRAELERRASVLRWMQEQGMTHYLQVAEVVRSYTRDPQAVLARARARAPAPPVADSAAGLPAEAERL
jgi:flagellar protein FlaI